MAARGHRLLVLSLLLIAAGRACPLARAQDEANEAPGEIKAERDAVISHQASSAEAAAAYLRKPGTAALAAALKTALSSRDAIGDDLLNDSLIAFAYREQGDAAGEERALSRRSAVDKNIYRYIFQEHRADLADALEYLPAYQCRRMREASLKFMHEGAMCPSYGVALVKETYRSGGRDVVRWVCPKCDGMLRLRENRFAGNALIHVKDNPLGSSLVEVAQRLRDSDRRLKTGGGPDAMKKFLDGIGIKEGQVVADIGCGIGYLTFPIAERVGIKGKVYAEDIDGGILALVRYVVEKGGFKNVVPVLGAPTDMHLPPGSIDSALLFHVFKNIWMEFDAEGAAKRAEFLDGFFAGVRRALKKDGTFILADRLDPRFGLSAETIVAELEKRKFRLVEDRTRPGGEHVLMFFRKVGPD